MYVYEHGGICWSKRGLGQQFIFWMRDSNILCMGNKDSLKLFRLWNYIVINVNLYIVKTISYSTD